MSKESDQLNEWIPIGILSTIGSLLLLAFIFLGIQGNEIPEEPRVSLTKIKQELRVADDARQRWNSADRTQDEAARIEHIRATKKSYDNVLDMINTLRVEPYADPKTGEFKPGYEFLEQYEQTAGQNLHDIVRRSKVGDFDKNK